MQRIPPSSSASSRRMANVRQKGTKAELSLRRELYRIGLRYRIDYQVLTKTRRVADIAFPRLKIAVFVDGCFWHGCPDHGTWPKQNADLWRQKIEMNRIRDADTDARLHELGWTVIRIWEHEPPQEAARKINGLVIRQRSQEREVATMSSNDGDEGA